MTETLALRPDLLSEPRYLPRVTSHDGRAIEDALAGPTLFDPGVRLGGAVIEATYAAEDPPLVKRLREEKVPRIIDPQTQRFVGGRFLQVATLSGLPYAPAAPFAADSFTPADASQLARGALLFEQEHGADHYLAPTLPQADQDFQAWLRHNDQLLAAACALNGGADLDRQPLIAQVAPGRMALAHPELIVNRLLDYPIDGVYVQPLNLDPVKDSLEKLNQYVAFLSAISERGLGVIASRVGAFGLVLQALGVAAFDSGLAQAEASNLAQLNRPMTEKELERRREGKGGGGPDRRIYLEPLKTTVQGKHAAVILGPEAGLRGRFTCTRGCCQYRGFEDLPDRRRQHFLWARSGEVDELRARPTEALRRDHVHEQLRDAREAARLVRRVLAAERTTLPRFEHIDRWIGVLGREAATKIA
jgi:hypothetical protein